MVTVGVVAAICLLTVVYVYNSLIARKNQLQKISATVDVLLKKRYDLVPQLVETVKGYMVHERQLLSEVTKLRTKAISGALGEDEQAAVDSEMSKTLQKILVAVERYPQLKASDNFLHLQRTLVELEEQISAARRAYNAMVTEYNNAVEMFPTNLVARMMGYKRKAFFAIEEQEGRAVAVGRVLEG